MTKRAKNQNKIDYRFKILYSFGIIFIITIHNGSTTIFNFYGLIPVLSFVLAIFAFSSGYFYKNKVEEQPIKYIWNKFKTLIIPLYLWNFFYAIIVSISSNFGFTIGIGVTLKKLFLYPITNGHQFFYNLGGWYVVPLFMTQVTIMLIRKSLRGYKNDKVKETALFILFVLLGIFGVYIASKGYNTNWWLVLVRMLYFFPYYGLGMFYKYYLEKKDTFPNFLYFGIIILLEFIIVVIYKKGPHYNVAWSDKFIDGPLIPFISGFLGLAFWFRISKILVPSLKNSRIISLIADNTYSIMINHIFSFMIVKTGFAILANYFSYFSDFDWIRYKTDIWYYYYPQHLEQFKIIYILAGIFIPILMQLVIDKIKKYLWKKIEKADKIELVI